VQPAALSTTASSAASQSAESDSWINNRLPGLFQYRENVVAGGLMSYGPSLPDLFRRAAIYAHRILKGAKPSELPVEAPVKFELVINLKTAKAHHVEGGQAAGTKRSQGPPDLSRPLSKQICGFKLANRTQSVYRN